MSKKKNVKKEIKEPETETTETKKNKPAFASSVCLPFEKPIVDLEKKIQELKSSSSQGEGIDFSNEIESLERKLEKALKEVFEQLTPWQRVQVARHPLRPYTMDYIQRLTKNFIEVHGDRRFSDDKAIIAGFGEWNEKQKVCIIGHQKGRDTKENLLRSFGSAHPEGYRKAIRVMKLADKFNIPIVCFIDTPGAYPGIGAEERGQAEAIAQNMMDMAELTVPVIVIVIGEGGSGGALGIGVGDRVFVLENAYYSVISPEGCAAILWKEYSKAPEAAAQLKLTGKDLVEFGVIDDVILEPLGGAHRDFEAIALNIRKAVDAALEDLKQIPRKELPELRYQKFRKMGIFATT